MKKTLLTKLFILFAITTFAQINTFNKNKLEVGFTFSPDYCYQFLVSKEYDGDKILVRSDAREEIPDFGFTTGISILYRFDNFISFQTGIQLSNNGINDNRSKGNTPFSQEIDSHFEGRDLSNEPYQLDYRYYYINIPTKLNYNIINRKIKWFVSTGISTNIFIAKKIIGTNLKDLSDLYVLYLNDNVTDFPIINFTFLFGTGLDYNFKDKWSIRLEPIYRQSLFAAQSYYYERYLYTLGINFGVFYKL